MNVSLTYEAKTMFLDKMMHDIAVETGMKVWDHWYLTKTTKTVKPIDVAGFWSLRSKMIERTVEKDVDCICVKHDFNEIVVHSYFEEYDGIAAKIATECSQIIPAKSIFLEINNKGAVKLDKATFCRYCAFPSKLGEARCENCGAPLTE